MMFEKSVTRVKGQALYRWKLNIWKGWKISIHKLDMRTSDGVWHSHQWASLSLCVWGFILEHTEEGKNLIFPGRVRYRPAGFKHRVVGNVAWTLILTAPRRVNANLYPEGPDGREELYKLVG